MPVSGSSAPLEYILNQNYPNPFNPVTKIKFTVVNKEQVSLIIYDLLGREVTRLIDQELNPGSHEVEFNGKDLSSGTYFYRITAGEFSSVKKMQFLK
jgi:hypothetical protein